LHAERAGSQIAYTHIQSRINPSILSLDHMKDHGWCKNAFGLPSDDPASAIANAGVLIGEPVARFGTCPEYRSKNYTVPDL
jgi:hypothetical protein